MEQAPSVRDPLRETPAGGRRLIDEAHRILRSKGASACTVGAITKAAGLDKSAVRYYFGNKDRLMVSLADAILAADEADEQKRIAELASAEDPLGARIEQQRARITGPDAITFLELVPVMLRHDELRRRMAAWQRQQCALEYSVLARCGDSGDPRLHALASLTQAIVTGLMVQAAPDPALDLGAVLRLWSSMLRHAPGMQAEVPAGASAGRTDVDRRRPDASIPSRLEQPGLPDPLSEVPESGRRLVRAAQRILRDEGWSALSVSAVTSAAGLDKAAVSYYFGDKAGLVSAMVESTIYDENVDEIGRLAHLGEGEDVLKVLLAQHRESACAPSVLAYFELVPHLMRDPGLSARLAGWSAWYRDVDAYALALYSGRSMSSLADLATLAEALTDGISLQVAADPDVDLDAAYSVWADMVRHELSSSS